MCLWKNSGRAIPVSLSLIYLKIPKKPFSCVDRGRVFNVNAQAFA
jgi:hypothetical protein